MPGVELPAPRDVADAVRLYGEQSPLACRPVAGGTDIMVMLHAGALQPAPSALLDLWHWAN